MAKRKPNFPKMTEAAFNQAAGLTRLGENAILAAKNILVMGMETEEAGLAAGYSENTARSVASRAALKISGAANICPCCKQPINKPK